MRRDLKVPAKQIIKCCLGFEKWISLETCRGHRNRACSMLDRIGHVDVELVRKRPRRRWVLHTPNSHESSAGLQWKSATYENWCIKKFDTIVFNPTMLDADQLTYAFWAYAGEKKGEIAGWILARWTGDGTKMGLRDRINADMELEDDERKDNPHCLIFGEDVLLSPNARQWRVKTGVVLGRFMHVKIPALMAKCRECILSHDLSIFDLGWRIETTRV